MNHKLDDLIKDATDILNRLKKHNLSIEEVETFETLRRELLHVDDKRRLIKIIETYDEKTSVLSSKIEALIGAEMPPEFYLDLAKKSMDKMYRELEEKYRQSL